MDYFNCHNPLKGGGEWKKKQALHFELKQGRKFYFTINNTTVKCLLQANSLLSPFSGWPTVPKVQHRNPPLNCICFSRSLPWNLPSSSLSWVNPDTLVTGCVKLDSFHKHWGLFKAVVTSTLFHFQKLFFALTFLHRPLQSLPLTCFLLSNSLVPSSRMTYALDHPVTPRAPPNILPLNVYCLSSFALRTTGCQAKAAVPSALVKESR